MMVLNLRVDRDVKEPDICSRGERFRTLSDGIDLNAEPTRLTECRAEETRMIKAERKS